MKKLLFTALLLMLISSCQNKQRYTQTSDEIETVKKIINAYNAKNYESIVGYFADTANVFFNSPQPFKASKLPEYHAQTDLELSSRGFLDEGLEYEMVLTDDNKTWVNFWGTWVGTLAANGKQITLPIHLTLQFIDGKVVTEYGYWDSSLMILALQEIEANYENKEIIKNAYDFFASGDVPSFLALLSPKVVWNEAENFIYAGGNPYIGADAIVKGVFEPIGNEWDYWKLTDLQLNEMSNGMVLATGRYQAKNKKNGKLLNAQFAHVWTLSNGKVTNFQQYTDTKQAAEIIK
ncbi:nuclear transport factor 2 family protein [Lutibacter sp. HS1-25]|uniref:nuclear transport factor 2 family protein n=1 Tax=Lutibacter sp. HS1-25 TaxID=2485000 RepID=UPI001F0CD1FC|nr:nuclear transport factor 2 family protein [Lutibacter sp. HS1-25]